MGSNGFQQNSPFYNPTRMLTSSHSRPTSCCWPMKNASVPPHHHKGYSLVVHVNSSVTPWEVVGEPNGIRERPIGCPTSSTVPFPELTAIRACGFSTESTTTAFQEVR